MIFLQRPFILIIACITVTACHPNVVNDIGEFHNAVQNAKPGDEILLSNGIWNDAELLFEAQGTEEKPIILKAREKGKVFLEGKSNIRISGAYLIVEGLVFRNGYTPTGDVISFRKDDGKYANHCRVTECVIDNYNNPERSESETWIALYGKDNRVDHCFFTGKRCNGVTLIVGLNDSLCRNNNHRIDHNYFGYRQNLGANGGETMRLGTSHYSLTHCGTLVEENYFEFCDGEHEIISNKSCSNTFRNNTFYECRGTLTFRHGNDNLAEGNFFFGNGKEHTGGIRIINKRNKAINNYFYGLTGSRFRGALVIMNGVPNSAINRYHQVEGGEFLNNTFINCNSIQLCAGSDAERSLPPVGSKIEKNLFYHDQRDEIFTIYDDISGITFADNYISGSLNTINSIDFKQSGTGLVQNASGIYLPESDYLEGIGCSLQQPSATRDNTGVTWYPRRDEELFFDRGKSIEVAPGLNTLYDAIMSSTSGDRLILKSGEYKVTKNISVSHPVTIKSAATEKPVLLTSKAAFFIIENGGSLKLSGMEIDGRYSPDQAGNCIVSTSSYSMNRNYKLIIDNCIIRNLDINHSFDFLKVYKNTFADSIVVRNSFFGNITGNVLDLDRETEELGIYNAEYVIIENSTFKDVDGKVVNLVRGGTDESTFGPSLKIDHSVFENTGNGSRNKSHSALYIHGVQITSISDVEFIRSGALELYLTNGEPVTSLVNCKFLLSEGIKSNNSAYIAKNMTTTEN